MEITFSLQAIAIIAVIIAPFFISGLTKFISGIILRTISLKRIEKLVDTEIEFRNDLSKLSSSKYYSIMIGLPVLEELVFRCLPFVGIYYFTISSTMTILTIGFVSSVLFGMFHWWNSKSMVSSLFVQGIMGLILFGIFFLFSEAFTVWSSFGVVIILHLIQNLFIGFMVKRPIDLDEQNWKITHYYEIHSERNFEKEFDKECEQMFKEQEDFEKMIGHEKELITSA